MDWLNNNILIKKAAAAVGIIEGSLYVVLSLAAIIQNRTDNKPSTFSPEVQHFIYVHFFERDVLPLYFGTRIVTPRVFQIFAWIYLVLNSALVAASCFVLIKSEDEEKLPLIIWITIKLSVCVWDCITSFLLLSDYKTCLDKVKPETKLEVEDAKWNCFEAIMPVLVVASKGFFTLWLINTFFCYKILRIINSTVIEQLME